MKTYTTILKNHMQKFLDAEIGKTNQLILHIFSTMQDVTDVSNKLKSNLALISLNFREPFTE